MISPLMPTYARAPLEFERGEGCWLTTTDGTEFLDFGAGIAVNALGHAHPKLVAALEAQARRVWHVSNLYEIPEQRRLAERLVAETFADTVFLTNSGTEAAELAIKIARKWGQAQSPARHRIVTFAGAFHGRSTGAIAAAGSEKLAGGFGPLMPGFDSVPWGDAAALAAAIGPETAAVLIEPIQGEGGIRVLPHEALRALRALCDERGVLLMFDEVQCGMGRTGHLFAHEAAGVVPDVMMVAKGIGGGFPLGAVLATEAAAAPMGVGSHGSTYGGNPLACAVGLAVMEEVADAGFLASVRARAGFLSQRLAELAAGHPAVIAEIRGEGLMRGLRIAEPHAAADLVAAGRAAGLLTVPAAENVVRLLPPLTVSEDEIAEAVRRLDRAATALEGPA
ncbi:aspartate aminotransferase family protein [Paralimibaculum aggregatum]|uniref:Acetylornithine aminotransferase n=1 Tax=Paralimibaculum aggregatum TaxID=3036245 RepID=A0ABQ6LI82_9RHOB|nr:aspartate aminotransferase family protein [Limibaculum sp. NKW23]GMG82982.1 aspartate aminotransferase family protein [Limibaculum sp. NKW23]